MTLEEAYAIEDRILKLIDKNFWPEYHEAIQVIRETIKKYDCGLTIEAQIALQDKNRELLDVVAKRSAQVVDLERRLEEVLGDCQ